MGTADVAVTTQLEVAERRAVVAKKHFAQLRDVCIAAQQVSFARHDSTLESHTVTRLLQI